MPHLTFFIAAPAMPSEQALAELTQQCTRLCTQVLRAAQANVHIAYVPVHHGRGHPVWADVRYRLEPFRTPAVMQGFMEALDEAIQRGTRLTPRIRCFGYAASVVHARN